MPRTRSHCRRTSAADPSDPSAGFSIVEMCITCGLLLVVLGVIYAAVDSAMTSEAFETDRTAALDDMRLTLNQMTRELRQATAVNEPASTSSRIEVDTYGGGASRHVVYEVVGSDLTRSVNGGSAVTVLRRLATPQIFTYVSAPPVPGAQWVRINLQVHPRRTPDTVLVLDSEVNLRNRTGALS